MSTSDFDQGWIIGFIEAEGSFTSDLQGGHLKKSGVPVYVPRFSLDQTNRVPLEFLQSFFGGGHIYPRPMKGIMRSTRWDYIVNDIATLEKVRDFCEGKLKHPFKIRDFEEWKTLFNNFLGKEGQKELARALMNRRWSKLSYRKKMERAMKKRWTKAERKRQRDRMIEKWKNIRESKELIMKVAG
jgi:hypothetical protein